MLGALSGFGILRRFWLGLRHVQAHESFAQQVGGQQTAVTRGLETFLQGIEDGR